MKVHNISIKSHKITIKFHKITSFPRNLCQVAPFAPEDFLPWRKRPGPRAAQRDVGVQGGGDGGETIEDGGDQGRDEDLEGTLWPR